MPAATSELSERIRQAAAHPARRDLRGCAPCKDRMLAKMKAGLLIKARCLLLPWGMPVRLEALGRGFDALGYDTEIIKRNGSSDWHTRAAKYIRRWKPQFVVTWQRFWGPKGLEVERAARENGSLLVVTDHGVWPHYQSAMFDPCGENAASTLAFRFRSMADTQVGAAAIERGRELLAEMTATLEARAREGEADLAAIGMEGHPLAARAPGSFALVALQRRDKVLDLDAAAEYRNHSTLARDLIAAAARAGQFLAIKKHPQGKPLEVRHKGPNHIVLDEKTRNGDRNNRLFAWLVSRCSHLITVNSTTWTLAVALGKPVACLGRGWYSGNGVVAECASPAEAVKIPTMDLALARDFLALMLARQVHKDDLEDPVKVRAVLGRIYPGVEVPGLSPEAEAATVRNGGERATAPTVEGINIAHVGRYRFAASQVPDGANVLDLGCGSGYGAFILASLSTAAAVRAVDVDARAVAYARKHYPHPQVRHGTLTGSLLLGADARYDMIVCLETIEHIEDDVRALTEIARVLRPGGRLVMSTPNGKVRKRVNRFHHRHYTPETLGELIEGSGLRVVDRRSQKNRRTETVVPGVAGRYLVYVAEKRG